MRFGIQGSLQLSPRIRFREAGMHPDLEELSGYHKSWQTTFRRGQLIKGVFWWAVTRWVPSHKAYIRLIRRALALHKRNAYMLETTHLKHP